MAPLPPAMPSSAFAGQAVSAPVSTVPPAMFLQSPPRFLPPWPPYPTRFLRYLPQWAPFSSLGLRNVTTMDRWDQPPPWDDSSEDDPFVLLLALLILFCSLFAILLVFSASLAIVRRTGSFGYADEDGPTDISRPEESEELVQAQEQEYLDQLEDAGQREGYLRAREWASHNPFGSVATDITLAQYLTIQEKGLGAFAFEPNYEDNPAVLVSARTEIQFLPDGVGMAPEEGGAVCVQSNLPIPRLNEVYYFEVKMLDLPPATEVAVGLTTRPYPLFRFPGLHKYSIGYMSNGKVSYNHPWYTRPFGLPYAQGDVVGVGYRPRGGHIFFTRNGRRVTESFAGLGWANLFPSVAANGPAELHVNVGASGFVFIEANVKRWGFAAAGTLPPPPPYGRTQDSVLIDFGTGADAVAGTGTGLSAEGSSTQIRQPHIPRQPPPAFVSPAPTIAGAEASPEAGEASAAIDPSLIGPVPPPYTSQPTTPRRSSTSLPACAPAPAPTPAPETAVSSGSSRPVPSPLPSPPPSPSPSPSSSFSPSSSSHSAKAGANTGTASAGSLQPASEAAVAAESNSPRRQTDLRPSDIPPQP